MARGKLLLAISSHAVAEFNVCYEARSGQNEDEDGNWTAMRN
jgi:hypothetical protein